MPPLREHPGDIPDLATAFLKKSDAGIAALPLSVDVLRKLMEYDYPGNVRELRNIIERALILKDGAQIIVDDLQFPDQGQIQIRPPAQNPVVAADQAAATTQVKNLIHRRNAQIDADNLFRALGLFQGNRAKTAAHLGVSDRTLYRYLREVKAG